MKKLASWTLELKQTSVDKALKKPTRLPVSDGVNNVM